ncbi:MAG TPA: amino acid adenylation domain-containing protein [Thermoanaerobaculia bacterium]|nr:amino acid adenylation domain-containing protein [Thermoanaerobaculia bacterium]
MEPTPRERSADSELRARLARRLAGRRAVEESAAIPRRPGGAQVPLSYAQERLWLVDRLTPGDSTYTIARALALRGPLDVAALRWSLAEIARRHEALRTLFTPLPDGEVVQTIAARLPVALPVADLRPFGAAAHAEALRLAAAEAARAFDLECGPLLRAALLRTAAVEHVLLLSIHHIVADGWSLGVLYRELAALYGARVEGKASPLAPPAVQYADYALWQRGELTEEKLALLLAHWRAALAGAPEALELPADRPRPPSQSFRGGLRSLEVAPALAARLHAFAQDEGATPFMALLALWQELLGRLTGRDDLIVGTPVAGRPRSELEGSIGFFVNTLPLRADLSGAPSFRALLARTRRVVLAALQHQEVPFDKLVEELAPRRDLDRSPLVQVSFALQEAADQSLSLRGLEVERLAIDHVRSKFDFTLNAIERRGGLELEACYAADLYDGATAGRVLRCYRALLAAALAEPDRPLAELPLLAPEGRQAALVEWNDTALRWPAPATLHGLFAAQAARSPAATALVCDGDRLTYGELAARVHRLARALRCEGVGPETRVAVCLERSPELAVALLAVLEAGAAYLPLDPDFPPERLAYMLADSAAPILLAGPGAPALPLGAARRLELAELASPLAAERPEPPEVEVPPAALAYLLYTSGSTGWPKGVMVPHGAAVNHLRWVQATYALGADDRVLLKTPISFDVSVRELFWPLAAGAAVVMARPGGQRDPGYLAELVARERVTVANFVPTLLAAFLDEPSLAGAGSLRRVIAGGEALSAELVERFHERLPHAALHNHYGPTETAINATAWRCRREEPLPVPIGRPIANVRVVLMDRAFQPAPIGAAGELWIGGAGLARGYCGRPDATAERFVPDPFASLPGERLYRTGDLARLRADGALEFLGRTDEQVKVRGVRIEPAEVEAALAAHPVVREAAAAVRPDARGEGRLVGYVVVRDAAGPAAGEELAGMLRAFLRERLPEAMVPSAFVALDALPVGPTGKLERRLLPGPVWDGAEQPREAAASDPIEELLAAVWAELLGVTRVGPADHFFDLGGHSLAATRALARVRRLLGVELPLRTLFERPRLGELAEAVREARKAAAAGGESAWAPALAPVPRTGPLPLSFAQERLWLLEQLEAHGALYNLTLAVALDGPLDVSALATALSQVVARHEILRTRFVAAEGRPLQEVLAAAPLTPPIVDLSHLVGAALDAALRALTTGAARRPFDLAAGQPFRAELARLGLERHVLVVSMHHIVSDGWSLGVLWSEAAALYEAETSAGADPLPPLPVQYPDFAVWQREWLASGPLAGQLAWWRERLAGAPEVLELPSDRPRTAQRAPAGGTEEVVLPPEAAAALRALARREGATLFMTLGAAFAAFLARDGAGEDLPIGTPVANRGRRELEGLIGFFVNTLVLRADLSGDPRFDEALARLRETALGAYDHQDLPFERLVEELAPRRALSHLPLFQVLFTLERPAAPPPMGGLAVHRLPVESGLAKFDLSLGLEEREDGTIAGSFVFRHDLFDAATVKRLASHFRTLAEGIASTPGARLRDLPLLTEAEWRQVTVAFQSAAAAYPRERCVHELVAEQAARRPEAVALVWDEGTMTYGELVAEANRLARRLRWLGVTTETRVGVCLERSPELVVALLGVLAAGGAYLPLDPTYPAERLAAMLEDGEVPALVTVERLLGALPPHDARVLCLDCEAAGLAAESPAPLANLATPESLAYVLYTSGSTGRPKGVAVPHRGIVRLVRQDAFADLGEDEVFLQLAPIPFDASTLELWGPLANGGRLVLFPPHPPSLEELGEALVRHRVTTLWLTSGLFHQMVEAQLPALRQVRQVLSGGDVLSVPHVRRVLDGLGAGAVLINGYGPTESTTFTCCHVMRAGAAVGATVPIGRPINHTRVVLLDPSLRPVPIGVPGELYIGGDGLARGYLDRPDWTAERFVPDPLPVDDGGEAGGRLYRTGDLARWRADGTVEFLGRADRQVKLRGFRIEPAEVEAALCEQPGVGAAAVVLRDVAERGKELVAYLVPRAPDAEIVAGLRERLCRRLPEYMVPTFFVPLSVLPLDPNGKLDRRALPEPVADASDLEGMSLPRTPVEELVAGIWAEVLGIERFGVHDDFFELGGHSLLATRIVSRLRRDCGVELSLRRLFEHPTVAELAADVEAGLRRTAAGGTGGPPPLAPAARDRDLPLSFAQERLWFLDAIEPGNAALHIAAPVRVRGALDVERLERALAALVARHEALRTRFPVVGGRPRQQVEAESRFALRLVDLTHLPSAPARHAEAARRGAYEKALSFDLARGPLLRATLLRLGSDEHLLLLVVHHIVADGWSLGILLRELAAQYAALSEGREAELPPLPVQYADYAVWQRQWLEGEQLSRQVGYWRERLAGAPPLLELPLDRPRPPVQTFRGAVHKQRLSADLTAGIHALGRSEGATLFMTLLAGLSTLLGRLAGQEDVCVGAPVAGRGRAEVEGLIGCFLNTLVLRARLTGTPSFRDLLGQVRETTLGAFAHQELPFEKLLEELQPERTLAHTPLFQVFLNVLNFPAIETRLQGLALELQPPQSVTAKFDLTLYVEDREGALRIDWVYNADLFDPARVEEMARQLALLLGAAVAEPSRAVATLPLLTPEAAPFVPDPAAPLDAGWQGAVHERFAEIAARAPEQPAVSDPAESWSYGELACYVHRLAHRLAREGVGKGDVVALWGHRSAPLVAGLLATLESGAAFVVLDPAYPAARLVETLRLARPAGFLELEAAGPPPEAVEEALAGVGCRCRLVLPPKAGLAGRDPAAGELETPLGVAIHSDDLAYLAFTSGSTGSPKGILGRHGSLSHFIPWQRYRYGFGEADRFSLLSGLSHDPLHRDVFTPLQTGGSIAVPDPDRIGSPGYLSAWLHDERVTVANLTPAMGQLLAEGGGVGSLPALRLVFVVGDILTRRDVLRLQELAPELVCVNHYGSTETQRAVGYYVVPPRDAAGVPEVLPLGRGIPDVQLLVVNAAGQVAGVGEVGEIWVRSPHVALGYLGEPERTAERFMVNPWTGEVTDRAYRTGDLGRYLPGGDVTFAGRADQQVKVRGFRIELGEIESVMGRHPGVREAAVVARGEGSDKRLVAYVVPSDGTADVAALRAFLKERLPDYMVPSAWVALAALPLTPNGKLDRRALPDPPEEGSTGELVAPRTLAEELVAEIWREVLRRDRIGVHDDFFDLGGHSLLATQVLARVAEGFDVELPVRTVFEYPTLEQFALAVESALLSTLGEVPAEA